MSDEWTLILMTVEGPRTVGRPTFALCEPHLTNQSRSTIPVLKTHTQRRCAARYRQELTRLVASPSYHGRRGAITNGWTFANCLEPLDQDGYSPLATS